MLTDEQRQQITDFCRERQIIRFWTMDEPLLNAGVGAGRPSVIVTFRPYWVAVPENFTRMERDLAAITGPETAIYSTDGLSPRLIEAILEQATLVFPDPDAPPATPETVARFCRQHRIAKLWRYDAPLPCAQEKEFTPSVIVNFQTDGHDFFDFFAIEDEMRHLFGPGATLYSESFLKPMLSEETLDEIAEVWYDGPA